MSVIKAFRNNSSAEFCNTAREIVIDVIGITSMLSARMMRTIGEEMQHLSVEILIHVEKANVIRVDGKDKESKYYNRKDHFIKAKQSLAALGVLASCAYEHVNTNPEGVFKTKNNKPLSTPQALEKINNKFLLFGSRLDLEEKLIKGILLSDKDKYMKIKEQFSQQQISPQNIIIDNIEQPKRNRGFFYNNMI